jgi:phage repressor protein C with HTH and peptisase S24 domain
MPQPHRECLFLICRTCSVGGDGDIVLVDLGRRSPTPPGIFVLHDGMGLVAKRLEHIPNSDPPRLRIISDNPLYKPYEGSGEEVNVIGRIRWFAREM